MPTIIQAPFDAARSVFAGLFAQSWFYPQPALINNFGIGTCLGPAQAQGYNQLRSPLGESGAGAITSFFIAAAQSLNCPTPLRVARTMTGLILLNQQSGFAPDTTLIGRDWNGRLQNLCSTSLFIRPESATPTQSASNVKFFWLIGAKCAADWYGGGDQNVSWVAVRYMWCELGGFTSNPFSAYLPIHP